MKIVEPSSTLVWITPNAERVIEEAGRTCYKSEDRITDDSAGKFIRKILASGHESVIEHASACFRIVTDRGVTHELVRHRLVSYSQESTRYCNYGKEKHGNEITVIRPPGLDIGQESDWQHAMRDAEESYLCMLSSGASPQIARSVLPNSLKTEIVTTANLREWRHIFKLRLSPRAHPQIQEVMRPIRETLKGLCPTVFYDL